MIGGGGYSSKSSNKKNIETNLIREKIPVEAEKKIEVEYPIPMDPNGGRGGPLSIPPVPPIDPLVRPRGLPNLVPQNLVAMDMPSNLPKFYGTRNDDPSRHMKIFVERMDSH